MSCSFAKEVWWHSLSWMVCTCTFRHSHQTLQDWWELMRKLQQKERRGFDVLFTLIAWLIWKEHNGRPFDRKSHSVIEVFELIKQVITLLALLHVARASMWITPIGSIVVALKYLMHIQEKETDKQFLGLVFLYKIIFLVQISFCLTCLNSFLLRISPCRTVFGVSLLF